MEPPTSSKSSIRRAVAQRYPPVLRHGTQFRTGCGQGGNHSFHRQRLCGGTACLEQHLAEHRAHRRRWPSWAASSTAIHGLLGLGDFSHRVCTFSADGNDPRRTRYHHANTSFKADVFEQYGRFHTSSYSGEDKRFLSILMELMRLGCCSIATVAHVNRDSANLVLRHLHWLGQGVAHVRLENGEVNQIGRWLLYYRHCLRHCGWHASCCDPSRPRLLSFGAWRFMALHSVRLHCHGDGRGALYLGSLRTSWLNRAQSSSL